MSVRLSIRRLIGWIITPIYLIIFALTLLLWHPLIALSRIFGQRFYHRIIALGNGLLLAELRLTGTSVVAEGFETLPTKVPLIIVANHQSLYDIPLFLWFLRRHEPCFIAKKELGRGIPSVSHALRNMGSVLINRKDAANAIRAIEGFGAEMNRLGRAAIIFPEGTRARDGKMRPFKEQGLKALIRTMPEALLVPVSISGSWEITKWQMRPVCPGSTVKIKVLDYIKVSDFRDQIAISDIEERIRTSLQS